MDVLFIFPLKEKRNAQNFSYLSPELYTCLLLNVQFIYSFCLSRRNVTKLIEFCSNLD